MKRAKKLQNCLRVLNLGLIAAITTFACLYLVLPEKVDYLAGLEASAPEPPPAPEVPLPDYDLLKKPLTNRGRPAPPKEEVAVLAGVEVVVTGTFPPEFAFMRIGGKETLVESGKAIEFNGKPIDSLRGWRMVECFSRYVILSDGRKKARFEVTKRSEIAGARRPKPKTVKNGTPRFGSRKKRGSKHANSNEDGNTRLKRRPRKRQHPDARPTSRKDP